MLRCHVDDDCLGKCREINTDFCTGVNLPSELTLVSTG